MILDKVLSKCPWTLILLFKLKDLGGEATALEVARELGVRTYVVKRGMWWLKKFKAVEEDASVEPKKFRITAEAVRALEKIILNRWVKGNTVVILYGDVFYVFICRSREIVVKTVPKEVVNTIRSYTVKGVIGVDQLYEETGISKPLISLALRVLSTLSKH
ncbi:MAG: hypothetical protein DRO23_10560 [Thermoprotei archaeon]|nr:MAG: hypothetical protein DRO23_10560 [Thermoprotei archaeon]